MGWVANKERNRKRENQTQCIIIIIDAAVYYYYYRKKEREREIGLRDSTFQMQSIIIPISIVIFSDRVFLLECIGLLRIFSIHQLCDRYYKILYF
jgi:hypothetical protein